MKTSKQCMLLAFTALLLTSGAAMADRGHGGGHWHSSVGIYVGPGFGPGFGPGYRPYYPRPYYGPTFYGDPYYYGYPPAVVYAPVPQPVIIEQAPQPPVYVEQAPAQAAATNPQATSSAASQDYSWYHCDQPEGYYPYIKECPQGWQKVKPEPPK